MLAVRAIASATPALLEWGRGTCSLARHRDHWHEGEARHVCGFDPDGPADDTLLVGRITADGDPLAVIVNYACHPTTLGHPNSLISPDYVGATRDLVEAAVGAPMVFLQGASGELGPRLGYTDDVTVAVSNGRELGFAVLSALEGMLPPGARLAPGATVESGAPLGMWELVADAAPTNVTLATRHIPLPSNADVARWRSDGPLEPDVDRERAARAELLARNADAAGPSIPLAVLELGGAVLVATSGEAYSALQLELRAEFPELAVIVVNLAGGAHAGYLPPEAAYDSDRYQVWQTPAGRGSLERVRSAAGELIRTPTAVPNTSR